MNSSRSGSIFLSAVVPMYNEEKNIDVFFTRIFSVLEKVTPEYEIICVNDGSTDTTLEKLAKLKKGRSDVIEKGHQLILGWNEMVIEIIRELIEANESEKDAAVVVLSEKPKEEMDDFLSEHLPNTLTTRLITRTGQISSLESLRRVGTANAKSVIILPLCRESDPLEDKHISDARVIKSCMAFTGGLFSNSVLYTWIVIGISTFSFFASPNTDCVVFTPSATITISSSISCKVLPFPICSPT